jgi:hypothetical protein
MLESNPPRNSRPQTHQDDGNGGGADNSFASGLNRRAHRIDRFAYALKNS